MLVLAAGLAGCGSDDEQKGAPIPAESAAALDRQLDSIKARFEFGGEACADITGNEDPNTTAVQSTIDALPDNVDPDVRDALQESFDRLFDLVGEQCDEEKGQETETAPPPTVETEPETDTETTETTPPPETETTPPETDTGEQTTPGQDGELPPGQGGENPGNGNNDGDGGGTFLPGEE